MKFRLKCARAPGGSVVILVDEEDAWRLRSQIWSVGINCGLNVHRAGPGGITVSLSREIMGAAPGSVVRHRFGDRSDFRKASLLVAADGKDVSGVLPKGWNRAIKSLQRSQAA